MTLSRALNTELLGRANSSENPSGLYIFSCIESSALWPEIEDALLAHRQLRTQPLLCSGPRCTPNCFLLNPTLSSQLRCLCASSCPSLCLLLPSLKTASVPTHRVVRPEVRGPWGNPYPMTNRCGVGKTSSLASGWDKLRPNFCSRLLPRVQEEGTPPWGFACNCTLAWFLPLPVLLSPLTALPVPLRSIPYRITCLWILISGSASGKLNPKQCYRIEFSQTLYEN